MAFRVAGRGPTNPDGSLRYYGMFISTANQTNPVANTANLVALDTTVRATGITNNAGVLTIANPGIYQVLIEFSWTSSVGTNPTISSWMYQNGSNIANTAQDFQILGGANTVQLSTCLWVISAAAGDTFSAYWSCSNTNVSLTYQGALSTPTRPASPSVNMMLIQV